MQIIEMYEPDEDLKKKGNKSEKRNFFLKKGNLQLLKTLDFYLMVS
jgi:hypothetical protein